MRELADYRWHDRRDNRGELGDLVSTNLAVSGIRSYDLEPEFGDISEEQALSILVHDAVIELYDLNLELNSEEFFEVMAADISYRNSQEEDLDQDLSRGVGGLPLDEILEELADYYSGNFKAGENIETERVLNNNGFYGRADIVREVDGEKELRDVKIRYSNPPIPGLQDEFKMACYALISRDELDIDNFVLEYPLQGAEIEVEPEQWFGEVVDTAAEFESLLEEGRKNQAELLRSELRTESDREPRDFVERLDIPYEMNKAYARKALPEGIGE